MDSLSNHSSPRRTGFGLTILVVCFCGEDDGDMRAVVFSCRDTIVVINCWQQKMKKLDHNQQFQAILGLAFQYMMP